MTVKELRAALKGIKGDVEVLVHEYEMDNETPLNKVEGPRLCCFAKPMPGYGAGWEKHTEQAIVLFP